MTTNSANQLTVLAVLMEEFLTKGAEANVGSREILATLLAASCALIVQVGGEQEGRRFRETIESFVHSQPKDKK